MDKSISLSVIILTYNEEKNISACLESVKWANELIVVDRYSDDNTVKIAQQYTNKVFKQEWLGFAKQRNMALSKTNGKWVFFLDADERVTPELKESILNAIKKQDNHVTAYYVKNKNFFMGRLLKCYQESHLRLFKNGSVHFVGEVHETPLFDGSTRTLNGYLKHYSYSNLESYTHKLAKYAALSANARWKKGKRASALDLIFHPLFDFTKFFILKGGFRDGIPGFIFCLTHAHYTLLKYAMLYEKDSTAKSKTPYSLNADNLPV